MTKTLPAPALFLPSRPARIVAALALAAGGAGADTVYRCGSTYTDRPCPGGEAREVSDTRSAAQQAQGRDVADSQRRLADDLRAQRLERERAATSAAASATPCRASTKPAMAARPTCEPGPASARAKAKAKAKHKGSGASAPLVARVPRKAD